MSDEWKPLTEAELTDWGLIAENDKGETILAMIVPRLIAELRALREAAGAVEAILARGERVTVNEYRPLRDLLLAKQPT